MTKQRIDSGKFSKWYMIIVTFACIVLLLKHVLPSVQAQPTTQPQETGTTLMVSAGQGNVAILRGDELSWYIYAPDLQSKSNKFKIQRLDTIKIKP